jgi:hypothetical protein
VHPQYAQTLFAKVMGFGFGIPEVVGEMGTALCLVIRGTRGWRMPASAGVAA